MLSKDTCRHYTGDHHNTHCAAGVCYRDVLTEPDNVNGSAFRKPCIDWDSWHKRRGRDFDNESQRLNWEQRGTCDKREIASDEEIAADEAESERLTAEFMENLRQSICQYCKVQVKQRQVGPCVYGTCGHRLYQGTVMPEHAATT